MNYTGDLRAILCHGNPYHDPDNGQFTEPTGSGKKGRTIISPNKNQLRLQQKSKDPVNTPSSSQTVIASDSKNYDKVKKALKIGGIALGSALAVLGARYLISDAVQTYAKRHVDEVLHSGTILSTLSFDPDRTHGVDMFYATHKQRDRTFYTAMFNTPISELLDKNGKVTSTGTFLKKRIDNTVADNIKIASEDTGARVFKSLCESDPDFFSYVLNRGGMQSKFVRSKYKFKGYREARSALENARTAEDMSSMDFKKIYRMFNYVIPNTDTATITQRKKFFSALSSAGYGGVLDTNDALYGGFKARSPVIVFDMTKIIPSQIYQTSIHDKRISFAKAISNRVLGLNL